MFSPVTGILLLCLGFTLMIYGSSITSLAIGLVLFIIWLWHMNKDLPVSENVKTPSGLLSDLID
jgi:hypothetical protein